jgi:Na+-driven multidrug efflux pump
MQDITLHLLEIIFFGICLIPAYLFRKRISYLFCPDSILGYYVKHRIFVLFNLFPSLFIAGIIIMNLREFFQAIEDLRQYENFSIIMGLISLLMLLYFFGLITDKVLYYTKNSYKNWRDDQEQESNCSDDEYL